MYLVIFKFLLCLRSILCNLFMIGENFCFGCIHKMSSHATCEKSFWSCDRLYLVWPIYNVPKVGIPSSKLTLNTPWLLPYYCALVWNVLQLIFCDFIPKNVQPWGLGGFLGTCLQIQTWQGFSWFPYFLRSQVLVVW